MKGLKDYRFKSVWASTSRFMGVKAFEQFFYAIGRNFSTAIPLGSCFECLRREYSFLVLTLGGASRSCSSLFIISLGCLSGTFRMPYLLFCELNVFDQEISSGREVFLTLTSACKVCPSFSLVCGFPG